mmetsp:Transcript_89776/g.155448  ORF Transcript_89776/g.155448 Transcript_89776/m.155448 type:complete len:85 (-) Transcript_89776:349-603(-)
MWHRYQTTASHADRVETWKVPFLLATFESWPWSSAAFCPYYAGTGIHDNVCGGHACLTVRTYRRLVVSVSQMSPDTIGWIRKRN